MLLNRGVQVCGNVFGCFEVIASSMFFHGHFASPQSSPCHLLLRSELPEACNHCSQLTTNCRASKASLASRRPRNVTRRRCGGADTRFIPGRGGSRRIGPHVSVRREKAPIFSGCDPPGNCAPGGGPEGFRRNWKSAQTMGGNGTPGLARMELIGSALSFSGRPAHPLYAEPLGRSGPSSFLAHSCSFSGSSTNFDGSTRSQRVLAILWPSER